jgi:hypothetical protein
VLKTENLDKEHRKTLITAFAERVNLDKDSTSTEELCNWIIRVCQQGPYDSGERLYTHREQPLEIAEIQTQPTNKDKLKWIQKYHNSPVAVLHLASLQRGHV